MISYNDIYEAARKERYSEQLQKLPKHFISEVAGYLKEKKEMASKESDDFSDLIVKTKKQIENATTLFKELILRRRRKILNLVLVAAETGISKHDFDNMLDIEKELFEELMKGVDSSDKKIIMLLEGGVKNENKNQLVIFKTDIEEFVGIDGERMGGFKKGDIANIPIEIAKILIEDGKAEPAEE